MLFMIWPLNTLSLLHGQMLPNMSYVQLWTFNLIPRKKDIFCKLPPHHIYDDGVWGDMGFLYRSDHFI